MRIIEEVVSSNYLAFNVSLNADEDIKIHGRTRYQDLITKWQIRDQDLVYDKRQNIDKTDIFFLIEISKGSSNSSALLKTPYLLHRNNSNSLKCKVQIVVINDSVGQEKLANIDSKKAKRSISVVVDPERDSGPYDVEKEKSE